MDRWCAAIAVGVISLCAVVSAARADVASDRAGAIVIFPKILVDTSGRLDTLIRISNTSDRQVSVNCFYVNATPKCSLPARSCFPDPNDCYEALGRCDPIWQETDFSITITARQPVGWLASEGAGVDCQFLKGVCANDSKRECDLRDPCPRGGRCILPPCFPLDDSRATRTGESNAQSRVVPVPEDPFIGELKCIATDENLLPVARNVLKGEAVIGRLDVTDSKVTAVDVAGYNALGIPAVIGHNNRDNTLVLGGPREPDGQFVREVEYEGCPNILILDHFADGGVDPLIPNLCREDVCTISGNPCADDRECENRCEMDVCTISQTPCEHNVECSPLAGRARVATDLTLVPCTQDFRTQAPEDLETAVQFLVFSEFEQRFSTSVRINCFYESRLSNIETAQNERSIFSAGVLGTLTGQTRIRGVDEGRPDRGNTFVGIAEVFRCTGPDFPLCGLTRPYGLISSATVNLHFQGTRAVSDFIYLP